MNKPVDSVRRYDSQMLANRVDSDLQSLHMYILTEYVTQNEMTWRLIICLRKSEVTIERISICNVIEKLIEHGMNCLPSSDVVDLSP